MFPTIEFVKTDRQKRKLRKEIESTLCDNPIYKLENKYGETIRFDLFRQEFVLLKHLRVTLDQLTETINIKYFTPKYNFNPIYDLKSDKGLINYYFNLLDVVEKMEVLLRKKYKKLRINSDEATVLISRIITRLIVCKELDNKGYKTYLSESDFIIPELNLELIIDFDPDDNEIEIRRGYDENLTLFVPVDINKELKKNIKNLFKDSQLIKILENYKLQRYFQKEETEHFDTLDSNEEINIGLISAFSNLDPFTDWCEEFKKANPSIDFQTVCHCSVEVELELDFVSNEFPVDVLKTLDGIYYLSEDRKSVMYKRLSEVYPI